MNDKTQSQEQYDEIDLFDYLKVVLKRKRLILAVFLLAVLGAGLFSYLSPKVYRIDTTLEIGSIDGLLENPGQVVEKIDADAYGAVVRQRLNIAEEEYPEIKAENPKGTNLVEMKIESAEPEKARSILREINKIILAEHQEKFSKSEQNIKESAAKIQTELDFLKNHKTYADQGIAALQLKLTEREVALIKSEPTRIVKAPTISTSPVRPNIELNVLIAGVLGLLIGMFLAFGKEFWDKNKEVQATD